MSARSGLIAVLIVLGVSEPAMAAVDLSADEADFDWPLTVQGATVDCVNSYMAIARTSEGVYALNGAARNEYPEINPIWKDHPQVVGIKVSISPLISIALEEC